VHANTLDLQRGKIMAFKEERINEKSTGPLKEE
jgi:hypothetical protein